MPTFWLSPGQKWRLSYLKLIDGGSAPEFQVRGRAGGQGAKRALEFD